MEETHADDLHGNGEVARSARTCYVKKTMELNSVFIRGVVTVLLTLVGRGVCVAPPQACAGFSSHGAPFLEETAPADIDLDNDHRADNVTLRFDNGQPSIELQLSRTDQTAILLLLPLSSTKGVLFVQDMDRDGDLDLVWQGGPQPQDVIIWLGDGTGAFERVYPQESSGYGTHLGAARLYVSDCQPAVYILTSPRSHAFGRWFTQNGALRQVTRRLPPQAEQPRSRGSFLPFPSDRGPPLFDC